ncbi:MAG: threonine-phosphate decarboxylase, partial [Hyphomicrobiaceae bacterium]|nr:threonine-phosphate decarboxylase [Hyphomicrobiaceae bacterium]
MLEHGGRLQEAAKRYKIPLADWLDLSTGINPNGWPVPPIPATCWERLPEEQDGLLAAAQDYYGTDYLLPVAGSQAAIQMLPTLFTHSRVGIIDPGYGEHHHAWQQMGHEVQRLSPELMHEQLDTLDVLVIIHPNNP